jgi:hypothetical protein
MDDRENHAVFPEGQVDLVCLVLQFGEFDIDQLLR